MYNISYLRSCLNSEAQVGRQGLMLVQHRRLNKNVGNFIWVFLRWKRNLGNLTNPWTWNGINFKFLCNQCLPGIVLTSLFLRQEIAGSNSRITEICGPLPNENGGLVNAPVMPSSKRNYWLFEAQPTYKSLWSIW